MEGKRSVSATPAHKMPSSATRGSPDSENAVPVAQTETHNASSSESTAVGAEKDILQGMEGVTTIEVDLEDDDFSPSNSPFASTVRSDDCYNTTINNFLIVPAQLPFSIVHTDLFSLVAQQRQRRCLLLWPWLTLLRCCLVRTRTSHKYDSCKIPPIAIYQLVLTT